MSRVDHPNHYNMGKYEVIDVIEDHDLNFNLGNVVKYVLRAPHKGELVEDLEKAQWYIARELARVKAGIERRDMSKKSKKRSGA